MPWASRLVRRNADRSRRRFGERRIGAHKLHQRHRNTVSVGNGGLLNRGATRPRASDALRRRRENRFSESARTRAPHRSATTSAASFQARFCSCRCCWTLRPPDHGDHAVVMCVADRSVADRELSGRSLHQRIGPHYPEVKRFGHRKRLHRRSRFKRVGEHPVADVFKSKRRRTLGS